LAFVKIPQCLIIGALSGYGLGCMTKLDAVVVPDIFTIRGVLALHMQAACHSQSIENTVFIFGNRASPSEK